MRERFIEINREVVSQDSQAGSVKTIAQIVTRTGGVDINELIKQASVHDLSDLPGEPEVAELSLADYIKALRTVIYRITHRRNFAENEQYSIGKVPGMKIKARSYLSVL
jgi:hypothetical protein